MAPGTFQGLRRYSLMLNNPCCTLVIKKAFFHVWSLSYFSKCFHIAGTQHSLVGNIIFVSLGACFTC